MISCVLIRNSVSFLDLSLLTGVINISEGGYCNPNRYMGITRGRGDKKNYQILELS